MAGKIALSSCVGICYSDTGKIENLVKNRLHSFYKRSTWKDVLGGYVVVSASDKISGSLTVNTFEPDLYEKITVVHGILKKK